MFNHQHKLSNGHGVIHQVISFIDSISVDVKVASKSKIKNGKVQKRKQFPSTLITINSFIVFRPSRETPFVDAIILF